MDLPEEELRKLKEGEIITGEFLLLRSNPALSGPDGKKYRVKKSMLAKGFVGGPHGIGKNSFCLRNTSTVGDPEDRMLRKIEADVVIPDIMNKEVEKVACRPQLEDLVACMRREGPVAGIPRCKGILNFYNECKMKM